MGLEGFQAKEKQRPLAWRGSKQGLGREAWAALLRVRTPGLNTPRATEGTKLRQQPRLWDSYPAKSLNLRHCQACSQNKGLSRASQRQAGEGSQSQKGAITAPERHHLPNCKQASLLTKTSWDSGRSTSTKRVAARDQPPEETHGTPEKVHLLYTQKIKLLGRGRR